MTAETKQLPIDPRTVREGAFDIFATGRGEFEGETFAYAGPGGPSVHDSELAIVGKKLVDSLSREGKELLPEKAYVVGLGVKFDAKVPRHIVYRHDILGIWQKVRKEDEK